MINGIIYCFYIFLQILFFFTSTHFSIKFLTIFVIFIKTYNCVSAHFFVEVLETNSINNHHPVVRCEATGANFGKDVMSFSVGINATGCAIRTVPRLACSSVHMPKINTTGCTTNFALVSRGNCSFSEKAFYVQNARYVPYEALIMYNYQGKPPISMFNSKYGDQIRIPVVMVNYECMLSLTTHYTAEKGYLVTLKASPGYYDLIKYLVPFVAIVGFCFLVLFVSLVIRLWRERRRLARKRLSRSNLKKIPTKKYKKDDREETCAVCLEDFQEGEKLRLLSCNHAYHCKCIDPWLTRNRKVCPVCKRKVGPKSNDSSDSDSEHASPSTTAIITRENDPLLINEHPMATNSSAEFPYPHNAITSVMNITNSSVFSRASLFFNFSRLFRGNNERNEEIENQNVNLQRQEIAPRTSFSNRVINRLCTVTLFNKWQNLVNRTQDNNLHTQFSDEDTATTATNDELNESNLNHFDWTLSQNNFVSEFPTINDENTLTTVYSNQQNFVIDSNENLQNI